MITPTYEDLEAKVKRQAKALQQLERGYDRAKRQIAKNKQYVDYLLHKHSRDMWHKEEEINQLAGLYMALKLSKKLKGEECD